MTPSQMLVEHGMVVSMNEARTILEKEFCAFIRQYDKIPSRLFWDPPKQIHIAMAVSWLKSVGWIASKEAIQKDGSIKDMITIEVGQSVHNFMSRAFG